MNGIECAFFGSLTRDADTRTGKTGKPFTTLNVAVTAGNSRQYVNVIVFGEAAEAVAGLAKDDRVYVEGIISAEVWTNLQGVARANLKVTSWHAAACSQIGRRKPRQQQRQNGWAAGEAGDPGASAADFHDDDIPL